MADAMARDQALPTSPAGYEAYVRQNATRLLRLGYLMTGSRQEAEDVVQDTLTSLLLHWNRVSGAEDVDAYVYRVLSNQRIAHFRVRRRRALVELLAEVPPERGHDPKYRIEDREPLASALAALPRGQRLIVLMRYWEDRSESDVASLLGTSIGNVKSQSSRGLKRLRLLLGESEALS